MISSCYSVKEDSMTGSKSQNKLIETGRVSISFVLSDTFIFKRNDLASIRRDVFIVIVIESYSSSFWINAQVRNCDGAVPKILMDHIFHWTQKGLSCEPLTCSAAT